MKKTMLWIFALTGVVLLAQAEPRKPGRGKTSADAGIRESDVTKSEARLPDAGAPQKSEAVETKTLDGGAKIYRFGELEIESRLKSPQIVYFLRRVRAEFAAGDLGHRSFMGELSETRDEPSF